MVKQKAQYKIIFKIRIHYTIQTEVQMIYEL